MRYIEEEFTWSGDLDRDCSSRWCGLRAWAERQPDGTWAVTVYDASGEPAWSTSHCQGSVTGGDMARCVAEWALRAIAAEAAIPAVETPPRRAAVAV